LDRPIQNLSIGGRARLQQFLVLMTRSIPLQLDCDGLHLRVLLQSVFAHFSPDAGLLETSKGSCGVENIKAVNPYCARANIVCDRMRLTYVPRPDRGRQAVMSVVGAIDDLIQIAEHDNARYGS